MLGHAFLFTLLWQLVGVRVSQYKKTEVGEGGDVLPPSYNANFGLIE